ncbi:exodeoxyribonuclease VII large subunit [Streptosporangium vulgare]|uniref:exodeoxyribonuclease VII large subunit n=1 Tax=Streptosporangium vulgare TaxID=46190 RepID=UPI0031D9A653
MAIRVGLGSPARAACTRRPSPAGRRRPDRGPSEARLWVNKGSFAFTALEPGGRSGSASCWARLERLRQLLRVLRGCSGVDRSGGCRFLPGTVGLICGRDSAAERDDAGELAAPLARRAVQWSSPVAVQGRVRGRRGHRGAAQVRRGHGEVDVHRGRAAAGRWRTLLPFSDEALARAVRRAATPVVSAIGHEQDNPAARHSSPTCAVSTPTDAAKRRSYRTSASS